MRRFWRKLKTPTRRTLDADFIVGSVPLLEAGKAKTLVTWTCRACGWYQSRADGSTLPERHACVRGVPCTCRQHGVVVVVEHIDIESGEAWREGHPRCGLHSTATDEEAAAWEAEHRMLLDRAGADRRRLKANRGEPTEAPQPAPRSRRRVDSAPRQQLWR